jgi:tetratricopeptide (TPR) repeat protein
MAPAIIAPSFPVGSDRIRGRLLGKQDAASLTFRGVVLNQIDPKQFVKLVEPLLEAKDMQGLLTLLKTHWEPRQIVELVKGDHADARKVALLALGLMGEPRCAGELAGQLRDPDPMVNEMAEHALWSLWFRAGKNCQANRQLAQAAQAMSRRDLAAARECCDEAIRLDPDFAEAYNQRAIVHYLQEQFKASIDDCWRATERMPCHFGAWAGMGHCYAHLGRHREALESYQRALEINPYLDCVKQAVDELKEKGFGVEI